MTVVDRKEILDDEVIFELDYPEIKRDRIKVSGKKDYYSESYFIEVVCGYKEPEKNPGTYITSTEKIDDPILKQCDVTKTKVKLEDGVLTIRVPILPEYRKLDFKVE